MPISPARSSAKWMDRAVREKERFVVGRRGEPAVVISNVQDFIENVQSAPEWLRQAWSGAKKRGLDKLSMSEIDAEIAAHRRTRRSADK